MQCEDPIPGSKNLLNFPTDRSGVAVSLQVIQWFQNKRREDRDGGRRKPQTEQGTGLDWFGQ